MIGSNRMNDFDRNSCAVVSTKHGILAHIPLTSKLPSNNEQAGSTSEVNFGLPPVKEMELNDEGMNDAAMEENRNLASVNNSSGIASNVEHNLPDLSSVPENEEVVELEVELTILIQNVVCTFSVGTTLDLNYIARNSINVEHRRGPNMCILRMRKPYTTAMVWSTGKVVCNGARSEEEGRIASRRFARSLQKIVSTVQFKDFRVVNVLGSCKMPWPIRIIPFTEKYKKEASLEPELHSGVIFYLKHPRATLKIYATGSITITAKNSEIVEQAVQAIYPKVAEFRKEGEYPNF